MGEINHHWDQWEDFLLHGLQSQVSDLALCKEREGTHDWIFVGILVPEGLTCSAATTCGQTTFPNKYLLFPVCQGLC